MNPEPGIYVNAGLSVNIDGEKPTWEPDGLSLQQVRHDVQKAREMHMRRMGELDAVVAALGKLGRKATKTPGCTGE